jgi:hypothetical protein
MDSTNIDGCGTLEPELLGRRGEWMQTFSGRQYWPLDPRPEEVEIEDIAHHLSMMCRYCGACLQFWSVAEHSVGVLDVAEKEAARQNAHPSSVLHLSRHALMHDGAEAYCHDLIRPIKRCVVGYHEVEARNSDAIALRFNLGLPGIWASKIIKDADNAMLLAEQGALMGPAPRKWAPLDVPEEMVADARRYIARNRGETCTPREAKALFLSEWRALNP